MTEEPTTYNNLLELLVSNGTEATAYQFGRSLYKYTACGPWIQFLLADDTSVYYESEKANETDWFDQCVGIRIGSIVEGSDVEIDEEPLMFPFTEEQLDATVKGINEAADFYWKRDNSTYYSVFNAAGERLLYCQWIAWDDAPTYEDTGEEDFTDEQAKALAFQAGQTVFDNPGHPIDEESAATPIPGTEFFVREEPVPDISF